MPSSACARDHPHQGCRLCFCQWQLITNFNCLQGGPPQTAGLSVSLKCTKSPLHWLQSLLTHPAPLPAACCPAPPPQELPILVADAADAPAVGAVLRQTAVVLSTAGPFSLYGNSVVEQSVAQGTHYCDITGGGESWRAGLGGTHHACAPNHTEVPPTMVAHLITWRCHPPGMRT